MLKKAKRILRAWQSYYLETSIKSDRKLLQFMIS